MEKKLVLCDYKYLFASIREIFQGTLYDMACIVDLFDITKSGYPIMLACKHRKFVKIYSIHCEKWL